MTAHFTAITTKPAPSEPIRKKAAHAAKVRPAPVGYRRWSTRSYDVTTRPLAGTWTSPEAYHPPQAYARTYRARLALADLWATRETDVMAEPGAKSSRDRIATPASTGGAGIVFEQHVDAAFLALLLVRGIPPVLSDCTVTEVHLQSEHLGWNTDDVLVVGENGGALRRRLLCQVKRSFTVSSSDHECSDTIVDFWEDFHNTSAFSQSDDRFAIITLRGTNTYLGHFAGLLDCARSSQDGADFEIRLRTPGFVNTTVVRYFEEIRKIIEAHEVRGADRRAVALSKVDPPT